MAPSYARGLAFLWLLSLMLTGCRSGPSAQETSSGLATGSAERAGAERSPRITIEKPILDLGEVGTDTKKTGQFEFANTGNAPLRIIQVHGCCGVTTEGVEDGQVYAPGKRGVLQFTWPTGSTPEPDAKRELRLQTNDPEQTFVTFTIKASVVRRVVYDPERLKLFLRRENAGCEGITIRSLDGKPFSVTGFRSTGDAISADFDPNAAAAQLVLKLRVDMERLSRSPKGVIRIDLTHPECGSVQFPFDVLPEFTINPGQLLVWNVRAGQSIRKEVVVIGNYRDDFEIESVSSPKGMVRLLEKTKVDKGYRLQIEIAVPAPQDQNTLAADTLEVKVKDGETVSIPFRGIYAVEG